MKKLFIYALLCLSFTQLKAQKGIIFKIKYSPDKTYQASTDMKMKFNVTLSGNAEVLSKLEEQGITQPLVLDMGMSATYAINTGHLNADKSFPLIFNNVSRDIRGTINGKDIPIPAMPSTGKVYARWQQQEGKLTIDSISGKSMLDSATQKMTSKMVSAITNQVKFPDREIKIGETFTQDMPLNIPVAANNMALNVKITYKLISIADGKATFDVLQSMDMTLPIKQGTFKINGDGKGLMVYNIKANFPESMKSDLTLKFSGEIDTLNVNGIATISADNKYVLN